MSMIGNLFSLPQSELDNLYKDPAKITSLLYEERSDEIIDLDKTWQAIHFILTGEEYGGEPPLAHAIFGVAPIGDEDVGYGPALGTPSDLVKEIASSLSTLSEEEFCNKFNPEALMKAGIYPEIWDEEKILEDYILPNFNEMKEFYLKSAENNLAVITFIN